MLKIGQEVKVCFRVTGETVKGTIVKALPNGVYVCRISKNAELNPGQEFRVVVNNLNEMVVLEA